MCLLSQLGLLREAGLIETEGSGENKGRVVLLEETVDYVKEATEVAVLVLVADSDERRGHVRRDTDGVLDVQTLWKASATHCLNHELNYTPPRSSPGHCRSRRQRPEQRRCRL